MLKIIGGVILGYLAMAVFVFLSLTVAYLGMGADRAFKPGVYEVTMLWLTVMFIVSIVAALVGGKVCVLIAKNVKATLALAGLVLVLGLLSAIPSLTPSSGEIKLRTGDVSNTKAMMSAKQPAWVALLMPVIGVAGVMIGGRIKAVGQPA